MSWKQDQNWELDWHSFCNFNTYWEETKQIVYAKKMGLSPEMNNGKYPVIDIQNKSVIDIGGGESSLLLKTINKGDCVVVDPCLYPNWALKRYEECGIKFIQQPAEEFTTDKVYDMCLIYNVLQHTMDPERIIKNALSCCKVLRIFEWIDEPISIGHPQLLTEEKLNKWLCGQGKVEMLNESGCHGRAYYSVVPGNHYEK